MSNLDNSEKSIYNVLNGTKKISDVIEKTKFENLDLITSNVDLSGLEVETAGDSRRAFILKEQLMAYLNDSGDYSHILIDCPPSLSLDYNGISKFKLTSHYRYKLNSLP